MRQFGTVMFLKRWIGNNSPHDVPRNIIVKFSTTKAVEDLCLLDAHEIVGEEVT